MATLLLLPMALVHTRMAAARTALERARAARNRHPPAMVGPAALINALGWKIMDHPRSSSVVAATPATQVQTAAQPSVAAVWSQQG